MLSKLLTIAALTVLSTVSAIQLTIPGPGGLPNTGCPGGVLGCVPNPCADGKCGDD